MSATLDTADNTALRDQQWTRFRNLAQRAMPKIWPAPTPEEAFRLGLKMGYGEGLVEGVALGIDYLLGASSLAVALSPFDVS